MEAAAPSRARRPATSFLARQVKVEVGIILINDHVPLCDVSIKLLDENHYLLLVHAVVHGDFSTRSCCKACP